MKKSEWKYLAGVMWTFAENNDGKISPLLKELIIKVNQNLGVIIDELDDIMPTASSNGQAPTQPTSEITFKGNGEF